MRIRKGHRCLPLPHANGFSLHGVLDEARDDANQALLNLVALADNLVDGSQNIQEHAKDTSPERKKFPEREPEENRVSADDNFNYRSSLCNAVFQMIEQGLPGLSGVGERLVEEVAQSFRNSSKFVECKERGTYCLQDLPAGKEEKLLMKGDSEFHHEKTVSSSDMLGAAKQLQHLYKSCSNSLGFGVIEPIETSSVRASKRKVVQNNPYVRQSKVATVHKDITVRTHNSISSASRSLNLKQMDQIVTLCTRDDGKGWKCPRPAQVGFAMCAYHRDLINQGKERRMRARLEAGPNPQFRYVANARVMKNAIMTDTSWSPFSDDELSYDEHRQFVKAKTITSLLLNSDVQPRH